MRKNMKRFLTAALCMATLALTGGAFATANFTASAATAPTLTMKGGNLYIDSNVDILFAVDTENLDESATVELLVWESYRPSGDYTKNTADYTYSQITAEDPGMKEIVEGKDGNGGLNAMGLRGFVYNQLELKEIVDYIYVCAHTEVNGISYYSPVLKYGALQYAYNKKTSPDIGEVELSVINSILNLGAAMQEFKGYKTPEKGGFYANSEELVNVKLSNAMFQDGFSYGVYPAGASLTVTPALGYQLTTGQHDYISVNEAGKMTLTVPTGSSTFEDETSFVAIPASVGLTYVLNQEGTAYTLKEMGDCTDTEIIIPAVHEGLPVTAIEANAFAGKNIKSVSIPSSVTTIGENAFDGCLNLTEVAIPNGVTTIGAMAFANSGLRTVNISASVNSIANNAFYNNTKLTSINVDMGNQTYASSNGDLYTKAGGSLIAYAIGKANTSFTVPTATTTIGENAFYGAAKLTEINLHDNINAIGAYAFQNCTGLKFMSIPKGVVAIGKSTFDACSSLESVYIPASVLAIGDNAFNNCTALKGIYYDGTASNWSSIGISATGNTSLTNATKYYYGETTYALASTLGMGTNGAINEEHTLDSTAKIITSGCFVAYSIQMYAGGNVVISSANVIGSIMFRSSGANTVNVYGSVDGITWTAAPIQTFTTAGGAGAYTVKVPTYSYKYLKLETTGNTTVAITELTLGTYSA